MSDIVEENDGSATVLVRRSKADPEGEGATLYLAPDSLALVRAWLGRSGVGEGRVFRSLNRGALGERLDASQVPRIFKAMAERAGLPGEIVEHISGHSTRVGAAQDMVAEGIAMAAIQNAGRWKTTAMVHRYGERLVARRSGAAQLARLQGRVAADTRSGAAAPNGNGGDEDWTAMTLPRCPSKSHDGAPISAPRSSLRPDGAVHRRTIHSSHCWDANSTAGLSLAVASPPSGSLGCVSPA